MGPRIREDKGWVRGLRVKVRNEGWVLAFARTRDGYGGLRVKVRNEGMGPRMREDKECVRGGYVRR